MLNVLSILDVELLHFNQFADVSAFSDELSCHRNWLGGIDDLEVWANSATILVANVVSKT